jgi:molecular chaperone Hsp33
MENIILPFQLDRAPVRGRIIRLGAELNNILAAHDYPVALSQLTGEAAVLALAVSSLLKYEGIFTLQAQGDGPVSMIVGDTTSAGELRACANIKDRDLLPPEGTIGDFIGKGYIAFTVDQGPETDRYQGIVELNPAGLKDSLLQYFMLSEQIPTGIILAVKQFETGWRGAAIIVQEMPEEGGYDAPKGSDEEDDWRRVMTLLQSCTDDELLDSELQAEDLLFRLFHEETVRVYEPLHIRKECRCSRERLLGILRGMPQNDLDYMEDEGGIAMRCEFCSTEYTFTREEISHERA